MSAQLDHKNTSFSSRKSNIKVICDGVNSPANVGSLFRICEAFGVEEVIFCNADINFSSNRLLRTARDTIKKVPFRVSENILEEIQELSKANYKLLALEITDKSLPIDKIKLNKDEKIALFIGNEQTGISPSVLNHLQNSVHIEMFGENSSMNVTHAAAIALFSLTKFH